MAISNLAPRTRELPDDMVDCDTASRMLKETPHPASPPTIRRWLRDSPWAHTTTLPGLRGRTCVMVSFSTVLDLQREHHPDDGPPQ